MNMFLDDYNEFLRLLFRNRIKSDEVNKNLP